MVSPGNRHCGSCIGTLSYSIEVATETIFFCHFRTFSVRSGCYASICCIVVDLMQTSCRLSNCCGFFTDLLYSLSWSCCRHSICCRPIVDLLTDLLGTQQFDKSNWWSLSITHESVCAIHKAAFSLTCLADERDLLTTHLYNVDQIFAAWRYMQCIPAT